MLSPAQVVGADPVCSGTKTYTWTYTDCSGVTATWVYTYTITPPTFVLPVDGGSTVACIADAQVIPTPPALNNSCGSAITITGPVISADPVCSGTKTYTWTYTDCSGATSNWTYTYTIAPPTFTLPADGSSTVSCIADAQTVPTPPALNNSCGNAVAITGPVVGADPVCSGTKTYTWTYTDCSGVTATWVYTYTITPSTFVLPADGGSTIACIAAAQTVPTPPVLNNSCGSAITITGPVISADPVCSGTKTYTWTYTDCSGVTATWTYTYTITPPTFVLPADGGSTVSCIADAQIVPTPPAVNNSCGNAVSITGPVVSADPLCSGTKTYTWTYTDCSGVTATWVYTYTITPPTFTLPANGGSTVTCIADAQIVPTPLVLNNSCGSAITVTGPVVGADPICSGTKTYTWTYTDCSGNTANWTYTYTITPPTFTLPADGGSTVACIADAQIVPTPPVLNNSCGSAITITGPVISADPVCSGTKTYTWTYTDCSGTTATWTYTYIITPPTFKLPADGSSTVVCIADAQIVPTSPVLNNSCGSAITITGPVISADPVCSGIKTYTWTYTDCSGATANWTYTYIITPPTFTLPTDGGSTVTCIAAAQTVPTPPVLNNSCGNVVAITGPVIGADPVCSGTKTYTWTYTDCSGATANWTYTYTITPPTFTLPADGGSTVTCIAAAQTVPTPPALNNSCGSAITITGPVIGADPVCSGAKTYTWTYTDCSGATANWTYIYTITPPAFTLPADGGSTVACIAAAQVIPTPPALNNSCGSAITITGPVIGADPVCSGAKTYTWTYTDCSGATANWTYTYSITPPAFTLPADGGSTVACIAAAQVIPTPPALNNSCGSAITITGPVISADPACSGTKTYTWTYTDCSGVTATWVYTYTITPPTFTLNCPPPQIFCEAAGNNYTIPTPIESNSCSGTITTTFQVTGTTIRNGIGNDASGIFNPGVSTIIWTATNSCTTITCTTTVIVNSPVTSTTNATICDNQLPYTWNGQTINAAGTYTSNLISAAGCDSIATLNLTVNTVVTSTTKTTICDNQLPYTWNGQNINAAGTYTANLISAAGCDSIVTLNLTVNPAVTGTTKTTICDNQLPYTWNGQTINAAGTYTAKLISAAGCDSIATLNLTVNPDVTSTTNTTICDNQLPYTWNGQTINAAGTYTANLISAAGCDSIATLNLTVNPAVTSKTNTTICDNQLPYTWNGQTINAAGTYTANLISAAGCDSIATLNLTVNPAVTSTTNTTICDNLLPYTWNGQTISAAGSYTANLISAAGCDSIATLNLIVNATPTSTTNTTICNNQLPYTWNGQTINAAGTYTANLISAAGCDSIATLNLTVNPAVTSTTNTTICDNQLPYTWNGQTINAAGTYTANLISAAGCDSIATLNLIVNATLTSTTNTTICNNQLPYTWNGQTINAAGTYTATLISAAGCDSIATLNLTVNPAVTSTTNTMICDNQLPYTWNGQTIIAAGIYTVNLISAAGCDSVATLSLTVNPVVTSTTNTTICNNQLPYTWNGQTINAAGTYTANLISATGCDSIATLNLIVNTTLTSITNTAICDNQLPYTWNGQTINAAGTYTSNLISTAGCDSIATLNLIVNATLTSITNTTICNNQLPYTWNGQNINAAGTYTANLISAAGCDSIATLNLIVNTTLTSITNTTICDNQLPYTWNGQTINAAGTYTSNLISTAGCDSVATLNLTVNSAVASTTNTAICDNQLPYTWNGQTINAAGTYTANLISAAGCDSIATLNLIVNATLTSTTNTTICENQLPYTWNGQTISAAGAYTANLISASGCDSIATLNLIVNATLTSTTNTTICNNQLPYTWNGQTINATGTYTANLISASGCDSIATLNLIVNATLTSTTNTTICNNQLPYTWNGQTINAAGTYTSNLISAAGCDSIATLNLAVNATLTSTTNTTICNNQLPYTWNDQTISAAGTYTANLISVAGCDSIATLNLIVNATLTSTTSTTICNNQLPYTWNGQTINAAGTYTSNLISTAGCDSVATLNLTVNSAVASTTNTAICDNQLPYTWNGQTINTVGTYTANLISAAGCDSIATLNLIVNTTLTSTTNTTICNNQLPYTWNGQTINAAGTYTANLIAVSGCDSVATLNLIVNATLTSTTNTTICNNQLPYTWNGQTINAAGTYTANLIAVSGCDSVATLNLAVNATLTSTTNTTICNNQLPYTWNGQTINAAGTYTANLISAAGCDSIATLNLIVNATLTSTTNTTICDNQLPYTWSGNTDNAAGSYSVTLMSAAGCDSIATLNLIVNATLTSTTNTTICNNQLPYIWNDQTIGAAGTIPANLISAAGCDSIASLNLTVTATLTSIVNATICNNQLPYTWNGQTISAAGTYTANLISLAGCDSIATLNLIVNATLTSTTNTTICNNQLPYTWNGQTINAAGTYTANLISAAGCDSIATLNLIVNATLASTTNTTICNNQLPYSWNGQTINAAGTYTANLISAAGCDSIATLNLTVNATLTSTTNTTICNNQLPYTWNGQTINAAGTYTANLISAAGCDSIAKLNLAVNATLNSTTNTTICTNQLPYFWNGQTISAAGTYTANLISAAGCDSIAKLNLAVNATLNSTTNTTICTNQLPYSWNGQTISTAGTYTANLISAAGCDSIATLNLIVNATLTGITNTTICNNQLPYTWNGQTINATGTYTANLISASGCDSIATLNLIVNAILTSTTNTTICTNQLPYTWNNQTINAAGTYTANLISAAGCDSIVTLNLTVNPAVTSTTNTTICNNQLPYTWNGQTINAAGTYTANLIAISGCDSVATLNLIVNATLTSTTNTTICNNQLPYTWNGQTINAAGTYTANLIAVSGCDSVVTLKLTIDNGPTTTENISTCFPSYTLPSGIIATSSGVYTSVLKTISGCDSIIITTLNLHQAPNLAVTNPPTICSPAVIDLTTTRITTGSSEGLRFTYWKDATSTKALVNPNAVGATGTYYIRATNADGCSTIKPVTVTETAKPVLQVINPPAICIGGTVDLTNESITAGTTTGLVFTYWNDSSATIPLVNPKAVAAGGTYYIEATNAGGKRCIIRPVTVELMTSEPSLIITSPAPALDSCYH